MATKERDIGATSVGGDEHRKRKGGWLWWLLLLAGLIALGIFLLLRNIGDDGDDAGVDVSDEQSGGANEDADTGEGLGDTSEEVTETTASGSDGDNATIGTTTGGADCPSDAGAGVGDETANIGSDPGPYDGCQVAVTGSILEAPGQGVLLIQGAQGNDPLVVVLTPDAENPGSDANGEDVEVEGIARAELDEAAAAEAFDLDEEVLADYAGQPYVEAASVQISN